MAPSPPPVLIEGLVKRLGRVSAVQGVDLTVEEGMIMGLAGPNGSGKSMTLRMLLGLVRPDAGRIDLFGEPVQFGASVLSRVGALIDGPGFVPHLSGLDNLRLAWKSTGRPHSDSDMDRALAIAGLGEAIRRPYRTYSHGMRYRLGLAQALLGKPDLVVLDEPTTGLDPAHIIEIRAAILDVASRGATVLFSSHQLDEVERICTHAAVMREGRILVTGAVPELLRGDRSLEDVYLQIVADNNNGGGTAAAPPERLWRG
jgi:ABC-2 type transport system ATP-binding protein